MNALLRLYPRAWRERYGDELGDLIASEPRSLRLAVDLIAGAIDARLHPRWTPSSPTTEGTRSMSTLLPSCGRSRFSTRASAQSAALMLGSSLALVLVYTALVQQLGKGPWVQALLYASFNIALVLAGIPTYFRNYRPTVRVTLVFLGVVASYGFFAAVTHLGQRI